MNFGQHRCENLQPANVIVVDLAEKKILRLLWKLNHYRAYKDYCHFFLYWEASNLSTNWHRVFVSVLILSFLDCLCKSPSPRLCVVLCKFWCCDEEIFVLHTKPSKPSCMAAPCQLSEIAYSVQIITPIACRLSFPFSNGKRVVLMFETTK